MRPMAGKVSVGETFRRTFAIYREQAGVLLPLAFWLFLVLAIAELLAEGSALSLFLVSSVLGLTVSFLYEGFVVALVRDVQDGRRDHSVGELVRTVVPVLMPLIGAGLLVGLGVGFGLLLLVAPGLYLLTIWAVAAPAIVVERRGVTDALGRSRQLVRGNGWQVLGAVALAFLIAAGAGVLLVLGAESLVEGEIVDAVFSTLAATVAAPIEALVTSVLYFRLVEIEGERPPESVLEQPGDSPG
jgi:hypothetical protein